MVVVEGKHEITRNTKFAVLTIDGVQRPRRRHSTICLTDIAPRPSLTQYSQN